MQNIQAALQKLQQTNPQQFQQLMLAMKQMAQSGGGAAPPQPQTSQPVTPGAMAPGPTSQL